MEPTFMQPGRPALQYISGRWYTLLTGAAAAGAALTANSIRLAPFTIRERMTISALGVRITTLAAAGNLQLAIYASSLTTGLPTGSELAKTASITTAATGNVNANLAANVTLPIWLYWAAVNADNGTVVCQALSAAQMMAALCGGSSQDSISNAAAGGLYHLSTPLAFNTWGDLSAATFTQQTSAAFALLQAKAA